MLQPKRILVVKLSDLGDVLTATPALRALRQTFRDTRIDVLLPPRSAVVLQGSALVDEMILFDKFEYDRVRDALTPGALRAAQQFWGDLRARRYDTLVLLHHLSTRWGTLKWAALALASGAQVRVGLDNGRGWFLTHHVPDEGFGARHEVEHGLAVVNAIGATTDDTRLEIPISDEDKEVATELINHQPSAISHQPMVVLHPGSGGHSLARRWPLERWVMVGRMLVERYAARVVIVGTESDGGNELAAQLPTALNLSDKTTLPQLAALLQQSDLFIGADSGVMHVAAAVCTPMVALFGTTNVKAWGPWRPTTDARVIERRCIVVQSQSPGCPCSYVGFKIHSADCEAKQCMEGISVDRVLVAVESLLVG